MSTGKIGKFQNPPLPSGAERSTDQESQWDCIANLGPKRIQLNLNFIVHCLMIIISTI